MNECVDGMCRCRAVNHVACDRVDEKTSSEVFPDGIRVWMTHEARTEERKEKGTNECIEKKVAKVAFTWVISFVYSLVKTNKQTDGWTTNLSVVHVVVIRVFFAINS